MAIEVGVGPCDVHELEDTELRLGLGEADRTHARRVDRDQFAGLDVAHEMRADDIERAGFAGQHPAAFRATEHERAESVRVAHAEEVRFVHEHERERAGQLRQHLLQRSLELAAVGAVAGRVLARQELADQFTVRREHARQRPEVA